MTPTVTTVSSLESIRPEEIDIRIHILAFPSGLISTRISTSEAYKSNGRTGTNPQTSGEELFEQMLEEIWISEFPLLVIEYLYLQKS